MQLEPVVTELGVLHCDGSIKSLTIYSYRTLSVIGFDPALEKYDRSYLRKVTALASKHDLICESMSKFVKILVFSIFYENHLPDRDLNFFI